MRLDKAAVPHHPQTTGVHLSDDVAQKNEAGSQAIYTHDVLLDFKIAVLLLVPKESFGQ